MTELQIQLQTALTTTFLANLAFLSEYDNDLYHRVDELSRMIEDGSYKEKYSLEFIMENGEFDIYDILNDKYLYNKDPKKMNNELIRKIQFDEKNSIFTLENIYTRENISKEIDENDKFNSQNIFQLNDLTIRDINEYTSILKYSLTKKKKSLKEIKKFIFLGTLLGRHIPKISEKIDADVYLVLERNLEIFRLSLFTVDYTVLAKKSGVIFSVMDSVSEEEKKIGKFLSIHFLENYLIKVSTTGININEYLDKILSCYMLIKPTSYDYNRFLYTFVNRTTKALFSNYKLLLLNKIKEQFHFPKEIPVLFLSAGPSLSENIDWIKANQNNFFIVSMGASYEKLLLHDIKVDMIFTLDEDYVTLDTTQFSDESVSKISEDTIIMASVITPVDILKKFNQKNLYLYEVFSPFHKNNIEISGFSVGEVTLFILLNMNIKELYLIGLDLALNQKTGDTHFEDKGEASRNYNLESTTQDRKYFGLRDGTIKIKGNLEDEVHSTALFFTSIKFVNMFLETKNDDVNVYNLSTHGAYFENSIPITVDKINNLKDIKLNKKELLTSFEKYSATSLEKESKLEIQKEIDFIKNILITDMIDYKNQISLNYEDFFSSTVKLISLFTDYEFKQNSISHILKKYVHMILPYLSYYFNEVKIKDEDKKIKHVKQIFIKQIENIIDDYILCLERLVK